MKKIIAFILCILTLIPLLLSCGGGMPEKTPEPATPEAVTPEAVTPEESYPKDVACEYGLINPPIVELGENNQYVEIIRDRETFLSYRAKFDAYEMNDMQQMWQYPFVEDYMMQFLSSYEKAVKAFSMCEEESYFDHSFLILIGYVNVGLDIENITAKLILDKTGQEKLEICIERENGHISFASNAAGAIFVSVSKDIGIQSEQDIIVQIF